MAEIGRECLISLRQALDAMSAAIADAGHPDPIKQIDRLLNEKRRSGKGDAVGALIDKYGVTYLKDLTLGAARELEAELLAL
jgi:predicted 3-demethylubiquinone-9 3-methyltransferase (glyoxalase superfamily)